MISRTYTDIARTASNEAPLRILQAHRNLKGHRESHLKKDNSRHDIEPRDGYYISSRLHEASGPDFVRRGGTTVTYKDGEAVFKSTKTLPGYDYTFRYNQNEDKVTAEAVPLKTDGQTPNTESTDDEAPGVDFNLAAWQIFDPT